MCWGLALAWFVWRLGRHRCGHLWRSRPRRHGWRDLGGSGRRYPVGVAVALIGGIVVYGGLKAFSGIRLNAEEEYMGADLAIHKISATSTGSAAGED